LAHLAEEKGKFDTLKDNLTEQISELPLSVNIVAREQDLIKKAQTNHYWVTITDDLMDELIERIGPLMKYRQGVEKMGPVNLNLQDEIVKKEFVEFGPEHESVSITKYREMVEEKIRELTANNPILQKLKDGMDINEQEAEQLAEQLQDEDPFITLDMLQKVYKNRRAKFIQFIKHILGIELLQSFPETVSKAIDQFIQEHTYLSTRQLEFINLLRDYIIERGKIKKRDLIQAPFTVIHPQGIRGVFSPKEIEEILVLTENLVA
jgi:type I restriction enzyme R subunit